MATAPIQPLAWEPPYAMGADLKRQKKNHLYYILNIIELWHPTLSIKLNLLGLFKNYQCLALILQGATEGGGTDQNHSTGDFHVQSW